MRSLHWVLRGRRLDVMLQSQKPFEPTSSWCYHFARYEALPAILATPVVAAGEVILLRDQTQSVLDAYLTPDQQNLTYKRANSDGEVKIKSSIKYFVAFMAAETGQMTNLGKGFFQKILATSQAVVDATEDAAIDDAEPDAIEDEDDLKGWVYAFTFPLIEKPDAPFPIKIGKARLDVAGRVAFQCKGSASFEQPKILGQWEVQRMSHTESAIHAVLKAKGKWREDVPGIEWFNTTPQEVDAIVKFVLS